VAEHPTQGGARAWLKRACIAVDFPCMRHFRLWLLVIGVASLVAEAVGAAAVFWRASPRRPA
jgi:hypothetical protein